MMTASATMTSGRPYLMDEDGVDVATPGQTATDRPGVRLFQAFFLQGRAVDEEHPQQIVRMPSM